MIEELKGLTTEAQKGDRAAQNALAAIGLWTSRELCGQRENYNEAFEKHFPLPTIEEAVEIEDFVPLGLDQVMQLDFANLSVIRGDSETDDETGEPLFWTNGSGAGFGCWTTFEGLSDKDFYLAVERAGKGDNPVVGGVWANAEESRTIQCGSCEQVATYGQLEGKQRSCARCGSANWVFGYIDY